MNVTDSNSDSGIYFDFDSNHESDFDPNSLQAWRHSSTAS